MCQGMGVSGEGCVRGVCVRGVSGAGVLALTGYSYLAISAASVH